MSRVAVYVDGFNLYHGLKDKFQRRYLWLDLQALASSLLQKDQVLERVTYFTAPIQLNAVSRERQLDYLNALTAHCPLVQVVDGRFHQTTRTCRTCGKRWVVCQEKETDVNIAVALVEDAVLDRYDTALLISADSDLSPAVRTVRRLRPEKRIVAAFPPRRYSKVVARDVDGYLMIGDNKVRQAQLPPVVLSPGGAELHRPAHWA